MSGIGVHSEGVRWRGQIPLHVHICCIKLSSSGTEVGELLEVDEGPAGSGIKRCSRRR